jgi:glycosyltransferase involved in cell wall biosynthesis
MKKIAIVHDWLVTVGGAERIIKILWDLFPDADLYTMVYDEERMGEYLGKREIKTSFIQKLPFGIKKYQSYLPLMPLAVEQFDLKGYDLVISSSTSVAKGVLTDAKTLHICYCNTPMRYAWDFYHEYLEQNRITGLKRFFVAALMSYIRIWDRLSADRVDYFIANSDNVANRIRKHYRRESTVIYPPVDTDLYQQGADVADYFLVVSRLVPYKRIDIVVEAFNRLGIPLVIVGEGSEYKRLSQMAKKNITFTGRLSDKEVKQYYASCRAFLFPGEEDFGITPLEAMSSGRPVIAFNAGGVKETVIDDVTGIFFNTQDADGVIKAINKYFAMENSFNSKIIRQHALKFSEQRFKSEFLSFIEQKYYEFHKKGAHNNS